MLSYPAVYTLKTPKTKNSTHFPSGPKSTFASQFLLTSNALHRKLKLPFFLEMGRRYDWRSHHRHRRQEREQFNNRLDFRRQHLSNYPPLLSFLSRTSRRPVSLTLYPSLHFNTTTSTRLVLLRSILRSNRGGLPHSLPRPHNLVRSILSLSTGHSGRFWPVFGHAISRRGDRVSIILCCGSLDACLWQYGDSADTGMVCNAGCAVDGGAGRVVQVEDHGCSEDSMCLCGLALDVFSLEIRPFQTISSC